MKRLLPFLLATITFALLATYTKAQNITFSGEINGNVTWDYDTVFVTGDVTVNEGATLSITPGNVLKFSAATKIIVHGRIVAEGTEEEKIIMYIQDGYGFGGISFKDVPETTDTSRLSYVEIFNAVAWEGNYAGVIYINQTNKVVLKNIHIHDSRRLGDAFGIICLSFSNDIYIYI